MDDGAAAPGTKVPRPAETPMALPWPLDDVVDGNAAEDGGDGDGGVSHGGSEREATGGGETPTPRYCPLAKQAAMLTSSSGEGRRRLPMSGWPIQS